MFKSQRAFLTINMTDDNTGYFMCTADKASAGMGV